jgi:hypothetical protein
VQYGNAGEAEMAGTDVIELAVRDDDVVPRVQRMPGPVVRVTMPSHMPISDALAICKDDLNDAVAWALESVFAEESAPSRVYVRDAGGQEFITMVDPCLTYGSQAIVRP